MWEKFVALSEAMAAENAHDEVFLADRISAQALFLAHQRGRAAVIEEGGELVAVGVLWETPHKDWFELGSLWVKPARRGSHLASSIYQRRLALVPEGKRCFVISHNPRVERLAIAHGFSEATRENWLALVPYEATCGPCDRKVEDKLTCPMRAQRAQCRLFVR